MDNLPDYTIKLEEYNKIAETVKNYQPSEIKSHEHKVLSKLELLKEIELAKVSKEQEQFGSTIEMNKEYDVDSFVKLFMKDKNISRVPLPEYVYEKYNIPKPETLGLNQYLKSSIKASLSGGAQHEVRAPKDNVLRVVPFISTFHITDLSGNPDILFSTINGTLPT